MAMSPKVYLHPGDMISATSKRDFALGLNISLPCEPYHRGLFRSLFALLSRAPNPPVPTGREYVCKALQEDALLVFGLSDVDNDETVLGVEFPCLCRAAMHGAFMHRWVNVLVKAGLFP